MDIDAMERLAQLRQSGALTESEYEEQKARLLGASGPGVPDPVVNNTRRFGLLLALLLVLALLLAAGFYLFKNGPGKTANEVEVSDLNVSTQKTDPNEKIVTDLVAEAKRFLSVQLDDPYSAQFENLRIGKNGSSLALCGDVNAKNKTGGYAGRRPFVYDQGTHEIFLHPYGPNFADVNTAQMTEFELKDGVARLQALTAAMKRCGFKQVRSLPNDGYTTSDVL